MYAKRDDIICLAFAIWDDIKKSPHPISANTLANNHNISIRSVQRIVETLSTIRPIYVTKGRYGGYKVMEYKYV